MTVPELPNVDVHRLRLTRGDVLVVTVPNQIEPQHAASIYECVRASLDGAGHGDTQILFKTSDVVVEVLGEAEAKEMLN